MIAEQRWTDKVLAKAREDYLIPRTCNEFLEWYGNCPDPDIIDLVSAVYKNRLFYWNCAKFNADWDSINKDLEQLYSELKNTEWNKCFYKVVISQLPIMGRMSSLAIIAKFPIILKIAEAFNLSYLEASIHYQPPGGLVYSHVDIITMSMGNAIIQNPLLGDLPYNTTTKMPEGYRAVIILVALEDWKQGQMFTIEDKIWSNWKAGDAITFDWINCRHSTANCSQITRPIMRIVGFVNEKSEWILNKEPPRTFNIT